MLRWCRRRRKYLAIGLGGALFLAALFLVLVVGPQERLSFTQEHQRKAERSIHQQLLFSPLSTWEQEHHRLAHFLDQVTLLCRAAKAVSVQNLSSVPVCTESRAGSIRKHNWTVISLESLNFDFERHLSDALPDSQIFIATPLLHQKLTDSQIHITPVISNDTESWLRAVRNILNQTGRSTVDVLKLGTLGQEPVQPAFVQSLLDSPLLDAIQQLHVVVPLSANQSEVFEWYKVLAWAKLRLRLSPFHTKASEGCNQPSYHPESLCIYFTSWLPEPEEDGVIVPQIKGSDQEQADTVLSLLSAIDTTCPQLLVSPVKSSLTPTDPSLVSYLRPRQWPLCTSHLKQPCLAYSAKYGGDYVFQQLLVDSGCQVHVFDPSGPTEAVPLSSKMTQHPWGFESMKTIIQFSTNNQIEIWDLRKPSEVIRDLGHDNKTIDILHLDVNAGEWDVFNEMITSKAFQKVNQVIATVHVWFGEEYYNLINQFVALRQMSQMGLEVYFSEPLLDLSYSNYLGRQPATPANASKCCFVVGWIKKDIQIME